MSELKDLVGLGDTSVFPGHIALSAAADRVRRGGGRGGGAVSPRDRQGGDGAAGGDARIAASAGGGQSARASVQLRFAGIRSMGAVDVGGAVSGVAAAADQASEIDAGGGVAAFVRRRIRGESWGGLVAVGI